MSKYRGPRLRVVRRVVEIAAFTRKIPKRKFRPGQHRSNRRKLTQFAYRLAEKQKLRFYYGISERKLISYIKSARKANSSTRQFLLRQLEIRLDNIIYRLGWAKSLPAARQIVNHGHIHVDKKCLTIARFSCVPRQIITVHNVKWIVEESIQDRYQNLPSHLTLNTETLTAIVNRWPSRRELILDLNELLMIEYYSNRL